MFLFPLLLLLSTGSWTVGNEISPEDTLIWGPGLKPDLITMRARYIFLQLRDRNKQNFTNSPGKDVINASIKGHSIFCNVRREIFDCKDGSFIIRYKLHHSCHDLSIDISVKNVQILSLNSPGTAYEEECYCPNPSIENWLENYECPQNYSQIYRDLSPFPKVDFERQREKIIQTFHKPNSISFCHYVVKDNKIYRQCYGQHVGFKTFSDAILLSLTRKVRLPDIEFFINLGDWPLAKKFNDKEIYPIFSWCGSTDSYDIVLPTYDLTGSALENMRSVMLDTLSVQGSINTPWEKKIEKLFWRGRDSRRERLDLIDIARKNPDLFNVSITNFFFFRDEIEKYGPGQPHVSMFEFFNYKYQLNIDGTVAAYRFPYLLSGDSLVLKTDSNYYEFFYKDLKPYVHYVPVKSDLSDLVEKIRWAKGNDEEALKIAKNGRQFSRDNLLPQNVFCYHVKLFEEWSKRIKNEIKVLNNMEEVPQPMHSCQCHSVFSKDEL